MSNTLLVLFRALAESLNDDGLFITGTATSGTSTTLVDTTEPGLYYTDADSSLLDRWFVYNELAGAIGRVDVGGLGGSSGTLTLTGGEFGDEGTATGDVSTTSVGGVGTLTDTRVSWVTNQWVGATATSETYTMVVTSNDSDTLTSTTDWSTDPGDSKAWTLSGVCPYILTSINPNVLKKAINRTLENMYAPHIWAPSLVADSDFSSDDVDSYWGDVGGATVAAVYNSNPAAYLDWALFGERVLQIAGTDTSGVKSDYFDVHADEQLLISVHMGVAGSSEVQVQLREQTSDDIVDYVTVTARALTEARFTYTWVTPITTTEDLAYIAFVLSQIETLWVASPVIVQSGNRRAYSAPSWFTRESQFLGAFYLPAGKEGQDDETYMALGHRSEPITGIRFLRSASALVPLHVEFEPNISRGPVFIECMRPFAELLTDSATTSADKNEVVGVAGKLIRDPEGASEYLGTMREAALTRVRSAPPIGEAGVRIR